MADVDLRKLQILYIYIYIYIYIFYSLKLCKNDKLCRNIFYVIFDLPKSITEHYIYTCVCIKCFAKTLYGF